MQLLVGGHYRYVAAVVDILIISTKAITILLLQYSILSTFNNSSSSFFIRTPQDEQVVRDLFLSFASHDNTDGDKLQESPSLNVDDMRDLLLSIGEHPSETKLSQLIDTIDVDKNGKIEYDEFLSGCEAILGGNTSNNEGAINIDTLIGMFHELDADGSGDLTMDEFQVYSRLRVSH